MSDVISNPVPSPAESASMENTENHSIQNIDNNVISSQEPSLTKSEIKRIKTLKLKVDGQEFDESLPFEIDDTPEARDYMIKQLQLSKMSQKRAHESSELRKQIDKIGDYLSQAKGDKTKLRALIKELGADEKELAAAIIEDEIANSQKSPEQLAKEQLEEELKTLKDQRKKEKDTWEAAEKERLLGQEMERYDISVSAAIEKSELPKSPYVIKKMADYMMLGLENDIDLHPDDVINLVKEEIQNDIQEMFRVMPEEIIEKLIGKDTLGKLRKKNVAKAKAAGQPPAPVKSSVLDVGANSKTPSKPVEKINYKRFFGV